MSSKSEVIALINPFPIYIPTQRASAELGADFIWSGKQFPASASLPKMIVHPGSRVATSERETPIRLVCHGFHVPEIG